MHEPFTHAHLMAKITFSQLPNGRDKLSHAESALFPRAAPRTQDADLKHPGGRLELSCRPPSVPPGPHPRGLNVAGHLTFWLFV